MKVSVITTLLNEAAHLDGMLEAIDRQTRPPDEVVVIDGGSGDGSWERLEAWAAERPHVKLGFVPGANISAGRNAAISMAAGPVIAATDGGCTPNDDWLELLIAGFDDETVDVVMGFYAPDPRSWYERMMATLNLPDASEVNEERFMPSSRSIAFRKSVWEQAGGYPEWLEIGEDMYFNFRVVETGARRRFSPDAVVRWRLRPDLRSTFRQYFRYAEGDGRSGMYPQRHALRFAVYAAGSLLLAAGTRHRGWWALLFAGKLYRMLPAYRRAGRRLDPAEAAQAIVALPVLELWIDLAKMAGYVSGLRSRLSAPPAP